MRLSKNNKVLDSFPHQECEVNACSMWSGYSALGFTDNQPWHANVTPVIDSIYLPHKTSIKTRTFITTLRQQ